MRFSKYQFNPNNKIPVSQGKNSFDFVLIVELENLEFINLIREDEESQFAENLAPETENVNDFINMVNHWKITP